MNATATAARPRGRPATGRKPSKNITLDADIQDALNEVADKLAGRLGFRPTLSQTLRHLINREKDAVS